MNTFQVLEIFRPRSEILPLNKEYFVISYPELTSLYYLLLNPRIPFSRKWDVYCIVSLDFYPYKRSSFSPYEPHPDDIFLICDVLGLSPFCFNCKKPGREFTSFCEACPPIAPACFMKSFHYNESIAKMLNFLFGLQGRQFYTQKEQQDAYNKTTS